MTWSRLLRLLVTFLFFTQLSFALTPSYYPTQIVEKFESGQVQNDELKDLIYDLLTKYHKRKRGNPDTLGCEPREKDCYKHRFNTYKDARRELFGNLHLTKNQNNKYQIRDVYCHKEFTQSTRDIGSIGPGKIPNHNILNCEHTWPKSRFSSRASKKYQLGDLHHLFPTDSRANSTRSSYDFGYARNGKAPTKNCEPSRFGNKKFEPPHEHKGNVARAMFYFSIRYQIKINSHVETVLKQWHTQDPVDEDEVDRNKKIYDIQQNRNPFIDFPELVSLISDF